MMSMACVGWLRHECVMRDGEAKAHLKVDDGCVGIRSMTSVSAEKMVSESECDAIILRHVRFDEGFKGAVATGNREWGAGSLIWCDVGG